ncbi:DUF4238 domain-containing protein [Mesorhizobium sp. M0778]|uniref:DUF4238 domain-containing protein n=1 Tax=Mesorhizobium sp. M0778 TaxID=2956999 RepID=UPI0033392174
MPANKIQHYVPRCYLRPFCVDDDGAGINLFNISRGVAIRGAPVRGQCARPYFYGKDGELEKALQEPEGLYAQCLKKAVADPSSLETADLHALRTLMFLQVFRSAAWIDRQRTLLDAHREMFQDEGTPEFLAQFTRPNMEIVEMAIEMYASTLPAISDLETCVLVNKTVREFISSDDPAVHTNRYHVQKRFLGGHGFGNSGAMLFMPMSPGLLLTAFDPFVYRLVGRRGHLGLVSDVRDVDSFNQLQVLHAASNIYFRSWAEKDFVAAAVDRGRACRRDHWFKLQTLQETAPNSGKFIPVAKPFEHDADRRELLHTEQVLPKPDQWPRLMPYVLRPKVVDTGSGGGLVRPNASVGKQRLGANL